ncbi:MAG: NAD-binding protein [Faecalibacterium sp.]|jgi:trk system potassium uptake protein TrkA|nr:NAD-binding protein [Faecalibacterium sp.]
MKQKILLIGGFLKTTCLAASLLEQGYPVTVINENAANCTHFAEMRGLTVIHGNGARPYVLADADAENMDIAIALTNSDCDNLVICELCKKKFRISRTVALVNDPKKTSFFYAMGINSVVCATNAITAIIEQQALMDEMTTLIPIGEGHINVAEVPILPGAPAVEKKLWELNLPKEVIIGCILRNDHSMIPRGDTRVLAGDMLVLICSAAQQLQAVHTLTGRA